MADPQPNRYIPVRVEAFRHKLRHVAARLSDDTKAHEAIKIVALGSSSTAGEGGIVPYPVRLQAMLRTKYSGRMIDVLNRGIGGEEAPAELARIGSDVIAEKPSLVIWQVGTNAVWQCGHDLRNVTAAVDDGLNRLKASLPETDVILMDMQYAPALLTPDKIDKTRWMLLEIIRLAAAHPGVNVFHRFEMMRKWHEIEGHSFDRLIDPSDETRLHQSDWSAQRIGYELTEAIATAAIWP
ncbi:MAG: SGNH/GDSL hydrolase family protein [Pseudomonadota bacterium]